MKAVGLMFMPDMVRAIANTKVGSWSPEPINPAKPFKGQTRRIETPRGKLAGCEVVLDTFAPGFALVNTPRGFGVLVKSSWNRGDEIYVKETVMSLSKGYAYRADGLVNESFPGTRWTPSLLMPKVAARFLLGVNFVWWELLHDITDDEAVLEGIYEVWPGRWHWRDVGLCEYRTPREAYRGLWETINGPGSWDRNPVVKVTAFVRTK